MVGEKVPFYCKVMGLASEAGFAIPMADDFHG
jgi:hypothetical protein